jgi:hypothetical protein
MSRERTREDWEHQREAAVLAFRELGALVRSRVEGVLREFGHSPAWLDVRMATGLYEDDLAESHGDAEDVFI